MTNQIIQVPDISVVKTVGSTKQLLSLRDQKVKKEALQSFGVGSGVKHNGDLYVLDSGIIPIVRMTTSKIDPSFTVGKVGDIEVDWGDGTREVNVFSHTYTDGAMSHEIVFYGNSYNLIALDCHYSLLSFLDISSCLGLKRLICGSAYITSLDVTHNIYLTELRCNSCALTTLDLTKNIELQLLVCHDNRSLTSLDLSKNTQLYFLDCGHSPLMTLNLSNNTKLQTLICPDNGLTSIDLSQLSELNALNCDQNGLTQLNTESNLKLYVLECPRNNLSELNVYKNINLRSLSCRRNPLLENNASLINLANSLVDRGRIDSGIIEIDNSIQKDVIQSICDAKNWVVNKYT